MGCRQRAETARLLRVSRGPGGLVVGPGDGRGAWLCAGSVQCFDRAVRAGRFSRALRSEVTGTELDALRTRLFGR